MAILLPERVLIEQENAKREQVVDEAVGRAKDFFLRLQEIDPNLDLVLAHEGAHKEDPRLRDGFWHVRRMNEGINDTYMPLTTPDGGWAEPSDYHLNQLRERDMWTDGGVDDVYARMNAAQRKRDRDAADKRAEMRDTAALHYKSIESPGILFGTPGWSYRAGARRG